MHHTEHLSILFYSLLYFTTLSPLIITCTASSLPRPVHLHLQQIYYNLLLGYLLTICQVYRAVYQLVSTSQQNVPQERHRHDSIHPLVHVVERAAALQHKYDMAVYLPAAAPAPRCRLGRQRSRADRPPADRPWGCCVL